MREHFSIYVNFMQAGGASFYVPMFLFNGFKMIWKNCSLRWFTLPTRKKSMPFIPEVLDMDVPCFFFEQWEVDSMGNPRYLAEPKSEVDLGLLKWIWWSMHPKGYDVNQVGWVNLMPFRKYRFFLFIFFLLWVLNIFVAPVNLLIARRPLQDRKRILPRSQRTVDERGHKMNGDKTTWLDSCEGKKTWHSVQLS